MKMRRVASYELPMLDRFTVDAEAAHRECPACGQPRQRNGRCSTKDCELNSSREIDELINQHERSLEG